MLGQYAGQLRWLEVVLPIGCGLAASLLPHRSRRGRTLAASVGVAVLLIGPAMWAVDTLGYPTNDLPGRRAADRRTPSTSGPLGGLGFPGGGRGFFGGRGGAGGGAGRADSRSSAAAAVSAEACSLATIVQYVGSHGGGTIAVSSQHDAAPVIIATDAPVAGIGGFTGQESDPSIAWLAGEVAAGQIRWVLDDGSARSSPVGRRGSIPVRRSDGLRCRGRWHWWTAGRERRARRRGAA